MRKLILFVLALSLIGLTGCAAVGAGLKLVDLEKNDTRLCEITVTSTPPGASAYVNDRLIGYTPNTLRFPVNYRCRLANVAVAEYEGWPSEVYVLKVSKEGYKDALETIEFCHPDPRPGISVPGYWIPTKSRYDFNLKSDSEKMRSAQENLSGGMPPSNADEISKYKKLMDEGTITKEEFEQKKTQLLKD